MTKYAVIGFAFLASIIGAFFYGQHVANDHNKAQVLAVQQQAIKAANIQAAKDQARDIASANQIAALQVANQSLQQQIQSANLTGGHDYVPPVSPLCPAVLNPLSSPSFRLLYDAGSRGEALPKNTDNMPTSQP
jgi:hypothetical protein